MPHDSNYDAATAWDQLMFQISHGKDPQEAMQTLMDGYAGTFESSKWDDLRFPASGITLAGLTAPPGTQEDTGLLLFDGVDTNETIAGAAEMPHAWKAATVVKPHVHWSKTTDAAGDVVWFFRYRTWGKDGLVSAWSSPVAGTDVFTVGADQKQYLATFGDIDMAGLVLSDAIHWQMGRLPGDAGDTYEADALLHFVDFHYQIDSNGSRQEFIK